MRNFLFLMMAAFCLFTNAQEKQEVTIKAETNAQKKQEVTIKAGTIIPLEAISSIRASEAHEGQTVDFRVVRNVLVNKVIAVPIGTIAKGTVYEAKRSSWWGTKGRLGIKLRSLITPSGDELFFASSNVYITGKNRTPIAVVTSLFLWPCMFICGSKAEMKIGYEVDATLANTTTIELE